MRLTPGPARVTTCDSAWGLFMAHVATARMDRELTFPGISLHHFWWANAPAPSVLKCVPTLSQRSLEGLSPTCPLQKCAHSNSPYLLLTPPYLTSLLLYSCFLRSPSDEVPALGPCLGLCCWGKTAQGRCLLQFYFNMANTITPDSPLHLGPDLLHL